MSKLWLRILLLLVSAYQLCSCLELVWKKNLAQEERVKFTLGSVLLHPEANQPKMLRCIIEQCVALKKQLSDAKSEYASVVEDRRQLIKRLEQLVIMKEKLETDLYGKFALILNEKKAKIRQLLEERASTRQKQVIASASVSSLTYN